MTVEFTRKHLAFSLLGFLCIVGLVSYCYFIVLQPIKNEKDNLKSQLQMQQRILIQNQSASVPERIKGIEVGTALLQHELPVKPLEEQLLLNLEKAEDLSSVLISSISSASTGDENVQQSQNVLQDNTVTNQSVQNGVTNNQTSSDVKEITFSLQVKYMYYEQLHEFLHEVENSTRIIQVESVNFTGENDTASLTSAPTKSEASIVIKAFYDPSLKGLSSQDPTIDLPKSCVKRTNPVVYQDCSN
jgi:type IV pilus assembly protein PilO